MWGAVKGTASSSHKSKRAETLQSQITSTKTADEMPCLLSYQTLFLLSSATHAANNDSVTALFVCIALLCIAVFDVSRLGHHMHIPVDADA